MKRKIENAVAVRKVNQEAATCRHVNPNIPFPDGEPRMSPSSLQERRAETRRSSRNPTSTFSAGNPVDGGLVPSALRLRDAAGRRSDPLAASAAARETAKPSRLSQRIARTAGSSRPSERDSALGYGHAAFLRPAFRCLSLARPKGFRHYSLHGGMAERLKAHAWKACIRYTPYRGFESHSLRQVAFRAVSENPRDTDQTVIEKIRSGRRVSCVDRRTPADLDFVRGGNPAFLPRRRAAPGRPRATRRAHGQGRNFRRSRYFRFGQRQACARRRFG